MIPLHARLSRRWDADPFIARLATGSRLDPARWSTDVLLADRSGAIDPTGSRVVLARGECAPELPWLPVPPELGYLGADDVVRIEPRVGELRVLYRRSSLHNSFLVTERCNSRCLMCSQPPRDVDDGYLVDEILEALPLISPETEALGFTGGEPTLLHERFIHMLEGARVHLPHTQLDVLTNGRLLSYLQYAERIAAVGHPRLTLCIPLYSDVDALHDFVVQARGAFDETVRGLLNLGRVGVAVEIRVVIHRQTYARLPQLAEFIARNLPFVAHVALMGLEVTGFTRANLAALWIDPVEYQRELSAAVETLDAAGLAVSIYNHPLCILPEALRPFACRSISDWKNEYPALCEPCSVREACAGLFATSRGKYSAHLHPL